MWVHAVMCPHSWRMHQAARALGEVLAGRRTSVMESPTSTIMGLKMPRPCCAAACCALAASSSSAASSTPRLLPLCAVITPRRPRVSQSPLAASLAAAVGLRGGGRQQQAG